MQLKPIKRAIEIDSDVTEAHNMNLGIIFLMLMRFSDANEIALARQ